MDQARQWTWEKRKHGLMIGATTTNISSHDHHDLIGQRVPVKASYDHDSWEEQAFAEDSSGPLGGCIWPPRSYSCSFCRREFRSAQALGGHMNVHRRDRARLKQSQPSDLQREIAPYPNTHDHIISPLMMSNGNGTNSTIASTSQIPKFPSLVYNPNPNSDPNNNLITPTISPPPPPPPSLQVRQHEYDSSSSSFHLQENNHSKWSKDNTSTTWSNLASTSTTTDKITYSLNNKASQRLLDLHGDHKVSSITVESGGTCRPINNNNNNNNNSHYRHTPDLSVSLNLVVCRSCPTTTMPSTGYNNQEDIDHHHHQNLFGSCKRRKTTDTDDNSDNVNCLRSKVFDDLVTPSCSIEELDLELRLGNGPSHIIR